MPPPLDLSLYIPVICTQEDAPKYKGKCFMEAITKVQKLNGESISSDRNLTKADFNTGDVVVIRFMNRDYTGLVDLSLDEESVSKRVESPTASPPSASSSSGQPPRETPQSLNPSSSVSVTGSRKRRCVDYPLPSAFSSAKKRRNTASRLPRTRRASGGT